MQLAIALVLDVAVVLMVLSLGVASRALYRHFGDRASVERLVKHSRPLSLALGITAPVFVSRRLEPAAPVANAIGDGLAADVTMAVGNAFLAVATIAAGVFVLLWSQRSLPRAFWYREEPIFEGYERRAFVSMLVPLAGIVLWIECLGTGVVSLGWVWLVPALVLGYAVLQALIRPMGPFEDEIDATRAPRTEERTRIRNAFAQFDREPGWVVVFEGTDRGSMIDGASSFGVRTVWIAETALAEWTDEELAIALAQTDERARRHFQELQYLELGSFLLAAWFLGYFLVTQELLAIVAIGTAASLVSAQLCRWAARRAVFEADQFAVRHFGTETVRQTYERIRDDLDYVPEERRDGDTPALAFLFTTAIPFDDRLGRIGG